MHACTTNNTRLSCVARSRKRLSERAAQRPEEYAVPSRLVASCVAQLASCIALRKLPINLVRGAAAHQILINLQTVPKNYHSPNRTFGINNFQKL